MSKPLKDIAVIIGMPRAGTTWLYENFKKHPDICVSDHKEINRYLLDLNDQHYRDFFSNAQKKVCLDISPLYFFDKEALARISKNHEKVILIVRNHEDWIESLNNQVGKYSADIDEFIRAKKYVLPVTGGASLTFDYGNYQHDAYINQIKNIFGEHLLVLDFALLQTEPIKVLETIESYLQVSAYFTAENSLLDKVNSGNQPISKLYSLLLRLNILHRLIPIMLAILPKGVVHWLRKRFVYGIK